MNFSNKSVKMKRYFFGVIRLERSRMFVTSSMSLFGVCLGYMSAHDIRDFCCLIVFLSVNNGCVAVCMIIFDKLNAKA